MRNKMGAIALLVAATAVACGGDSKDEASTTTTAAPVTTAASPTYTGDKDSRFCQLAADFESRVQNISSALGGTAEQARTQLTELNGVVDEARENAPQSVKADVQVLYDRFTQFFAQVQAGAFSPQSIARAGAELSSPEIQTSIDRLERYTQQVCGIQAGG